MMMRGQYAQLQAPGLHSIFVDFLDADVRDFEYDKIFNIETSESAYEDEAEFAGMGPWVEKPEGESVEYDSLIQGGTKRFLHATYALGMRYSFELFDDDMYGLIKQGPKALALGARFIIEQNSFNVFNLGFTTVTSIDGVSLFNSQHPLLGGAQATNRGPGVAAVITSVSGSAGTYPNRPNPATDLGITSLQAAIRHYERMTNHQGFPAAYRPKMVLVPPELKWVAREILGSAYKPYTAENEINALVGEDLSYFVGHYLTDEDAWFLLPDKSEHQLKFYWRKKQDEKFDDNFDTLSMKQLAYMRFSVGPVSHLGTWGSPGA